MDPSGHRGRQAASRDVLSAPRLAFAIYCVPIAAIVATGIAPVGAAWRTPVWTLALAEMGTACLVNAARCGRMHCYFTGPFLLAMAVVTLLYGLGLVPLAGYGWAVIGSALVIGGCLLTYVPERVYGRYRR